MKALRRVLRALLILIGIVVAIPLLGIAYGLVATGSVEPGPLPGIEESAPPQALAEQVRADIVGYQRPEESTFLTYPEWSIVYAAREYAAFVAENRESAFPYWAYIGRFWEDYATVVRATEGYPFNFQNHIMLVVIGTSHTIEHAIQWAYENTVGGITEWIAGAPVPEDRHQAAVAAEYAAFLDQVPWYRFPYAEKRGSLWDTDPASGFAAIRSWERKLAFGLAYTIKQTYADLIASGLAATSDPAFLDIHVWAQGPVTDAIAGEPDTVLERDLGPDGAVFVTKRYQVFTEMIPRLISKGVRFVEIGGNDEILVTVLSRDKVEPPAGSRILFGYRLPVDPAVRRTGLLIGIRSLHSALPALERDETRLEHVYDY